MHKDAWKSLSSKIVYENKWGRIIREHQIIRPTGKEGTYAVYEVNPAAYVIALTDQNEIYLINQFRFPIQKYVWQLPAGGLDGQDPKIAAQRELKEETGLEAKEWVYIGEFECSPGSSSEKGIVFLAKELTQTEENEQEEEGIEKVQKFKIAEVIEMIKQGEITDATLIAPLLMAADYLGINTCVTF